MGRQSGNNQIHRAQQALKEAGYDPGPTDGHLGPRTRQALRNYQRDHGLPVTGQLNRATRQALLGEKGAAAARSQEQTPATLGRLLTKDRIRIAEKNLQELGFDPGPVDGVSTDQTTAAVRAFQERRGLRSRVCWMM